MNSLVIPVKTLLADILSKSASVLRFDVLVDVVETVPLELLLFFHCLSVAIVFKNKHPNGFMSLIQGFLGAFGGGIASSFFLGTPSESILFQNAAAVPLWVSAWWLVNCNPWSQARAIFDVPEVLNFLNIYTQITRARTIASRADVVMKSAYPAKLIVALIAATLGASGGKLSVDAVDAISGLKSSSELAAPGYSLRSSVIGSSIYLITSSASLLGGLKDKEALGLLLLIFVGQAVMQGFVDPSFDWSNPVVDVIQLVTFTKSQTVVVKKPTTSRGRSKSTSRSASKPRSRTTSKSRAKKE